MMYTNLQSRLGVEIEAARQDISLIPSNSACKLSDSEILTLKSISGLEKIRTV